MPYILLCLVTFTYLFPTQALSRSDSLLQPNIPLDVATTPTDSTQPHWLKKRQHQVNRHAWRTFNALMWPATPASSPPAPQPNTSLSVWETWKAQADVYRADGTAPSAWNSPTPLPAACQAQPGETLRYLHQDEKVDDVIDAVNQAVKADATLPGTLTDQHGQVVRYEIRMNQTVFDYIVANKLYNGQQQALANQVSFPDGAILIKAAWRELTAATPPKDRRRFITRAACICADATQTACHRAEVALVGFHIMHKTPSAPQWLWSTFEHKANVRRNHGLAASFHKPRCRGQYCTPNTQTPTGTPNQVTRVLKSNKALRNLNHRMHRRFKKHQSVLQHYRLMSAQWPIQTEASTKHPTVFRAQPPFSANTTMETFAQETSSCMGCHVMSRTLKPDQLVSGDFSFTLNNAQPKPAGAVCDSYSYSNSIGCSQDTILFNPQALATYPATQAAQITRGHQLVSHTYEQLPQHVGNKLHCRSCHLHAGGVPEASWWVGMRTAYRSKDPTLQNQYPAAALQGRVNQCFERSLHGKALCTPASMTTQGIAAGDCATNTEMSAILAYMDWLTATYQQKQGCDQIGNSPKCTPARGFPNLTQANVIGNPINGQTTFQQKCAFCHNSEGQGRYASNTYFRPALWGNQSYPSQAGMGKPEKLARFIRWNMPYGSGGLLTDQEAQDIACYIDSQPRPGKTSSPTSSAQCLPASLAQ